MMKDDGISSKDPELNMFEIMHFNRCYILIFTLN